jgi:Flp pilus assembly protein protease CpaA
LFVALVVAGVIDMRTTKIPNALTFPLMLLGLLVQATVGTGITDGLMGLAAAFAIHYVLWQIKLEGAGDAKLMMAVGAFVGWTTMFEATLWRYVLQIPYAAAVLTFKGRWGNFREASRWTLLKAQGVDVGARPEPTLMPFGPLIAVAAPIALYTDYLDYFG